MVGPTPTRNEAIMIAAKGQPHCLMHKGYGCCPSMLNIKRALEDESNPAPFKFSQPLETFSMTSQLLVLLIFCRYQN